MKSAFAAPWGVELRMTSLAGSLLLLGISTIGGQMDRLAPMARISIIVFPLVLLLGTLLFVVRRYELGADALLIQRLFWRTRLPLEGISSAASGGEGIARSLRLFGNGGLFSFTGIFWNKRLGVYRAYVNDPKRCIVLKVGKKTIVVSPDNPEEFVAAVRRKFALS